MSEALHDWGYTDEMICPRCEKVFAVLNPEGDSPDFCPFCGGIGLKDYNPDDEDNA